ncbi:MAG: metalloregulator ArsR/SmtB family transcription factor [Desulfobulbaceae bacterium]|nr:metalloregulator ArsR/SmtB family transcription factor [Desulfobulbaceae bacterium]
MKGFIRVMKALSDPSRVKIIKMLSRKEMCVCEITAVLKLAQPTISKHLKILEDAGLVDFSKDGSWVNYRLDLQSANQYAEVMLEHMQNWLEDDKEIREILARAKEVNRASCNAP